MTTKPASLRLDDQLCFSLYSASRAVTGLYRTLLDDLELTYPQYLVMLALWDEDERLVKELGIALNLDSGTLSPLLKRLETAGLVRRDRREDDERSVRISLTERGNKLKSKAVGIPDMVAEAMALSPAKLDEMRDAMSLLTDSVNAYRASHA